VCAGVAARKHAATVSKATVALLPTTYGEPTDRRTEYSIGPVGNVARMPDGVQPYHAAGRSLSLPANVTSPTESASPMTPITFPGRGQRGSIGSVGLMGSWSERTRPPASSRVLGWRNVAAQIVQPAGIAFRLASHSSRLYAPAPNAASNKNAQEYKAARSPPLAHQNNPREPWIQK